jgi:starvation-inducible DNA-binding protein
MAKQTRALPHQTRNDLSPSTRSQVVALLNARLADTLDLYMQAKQAHWNVKGPDFYQLHELFDKVAETLASAGDDIAERAVQLGGIAEGTVQVVRDRTTIPAYPLAIAEGAAHVKALADAIAGVARSTRKAIDEAEKAGDKDTSDLFTEISRSLDKQLWFVEAHRQASR